MNAKRKKPPAPTLAGIHEGLQRLADEAEQLCEAEESETCPRESTLRDAADLVEHLLNPANDDAEVEDDEDAA